MRRFCSDGDGLGQVLEEFMLNKEKMGGMLLVDAEDGGSGIGVDRADKNQGFL